MFKSIFAAISAVFNIIETAARAANRLANTGDLYAAQIEAEAKLEVGPALAKAKAKFTELNLTDEDLK